jgi:DNA-directed RNA polymerase specialized sigma24 family protein
METVEVARLLKVTEGTVKSTLSRARAALVAALGETTEQEATDNGAR